MLDLLYFYPYDIIFFLDLLIFLLELLIILLIFLLELLIFLLELLIFLLELLIFLLNVAISSQDFCLQFLNMSVSYLKDMVTRSIHVHSIIIRLRYTLAQAVSLFKLFLVLPLLLLPFPAVQLHVFPKYRHKIPLFAHVLDIHGI